jgi:hypothetical protein
MGEYLSSVVITPNAALALGADGALLFRHILRNLPARMPYSRVEHYA